MRWLWKIESNDQSLWTITVQRFYGVDLQSVNHLFFFLADLIELLPILRVSTTRDPHGSLLWRWGQNNTYSSKSVQLLLSNPGIKPIVASILWKSKIPERVRLFFGCFPKTDCPHLTIWLPRTGRITPHVSYVWGTSKKHPPTYSYNALIVRLFGTPRIDRTLTPTLLTSG